MENRDEIAERLSEIDDIGLILRTLIKHDALSRQRILNYVIDWHRVSADCQRAEAGTESEGAK